MSDPSRPTSRWSTSMSVTTKSTGYTNQTIPLMNVRKKLFRHAENNKKTYAQRLAKSKHDIEELFKLYYSNDIKFDTFHQQIVTGTRIPTVRTSPLSQNNLTNSSTNIFNSKHCVSRDQLSNTDLDEKDNETTTTATTIKTKTIKSAPIRRTVQIRTENNSIIHSPTPNNHFPSTVTTPVISNRLATSSTTQQEELCDSLLVKSVAFLEEISNEIQEDLNTNKSNTTPRSKSSLLTLSPAPPPPSLLVMNNNNNRKDPTILSHTSFSTMNSTQQQQQQESQQRYSPAVVTGSAVIVRQRSPIRQTWTRQRIKSNTTMTTNSSLAQSTTKTHSPSILSPLSIQPDMPEVPVYFGAQRVVSIPSKCSRYVLVTFPEVPLRYSAPSYVERLLLPERFPTLFQNIVHSYDPHLTTSSIPHHQNMK